MAFPDYEKLFLLEVLVDGVHISSSSLNLDQTTKSNLKETCVMFQFLNYPPLVVCEEDFLKSPPNLSESQINFKSGKSCLFSIRSSVVPTLPYKFDINVSVIRKVEPKSKIILGTSVIHLGDSFTALIHSSVAEPDLPLQKTKTGTFDVYDGNKRKIGYINSFLRLSCFGQLIVTQFQVGADKNNFMFRGTEQRQVVEIPGDSAKIPKIQVDPNYVTPTPLRPERPPEEVPQVQRRARASSGDGDVTENAVVPIQQNGMGMAPVMPQYGYGYDSYEQPPPPGDTSGDYKEIVAEIRGHSLHIRVPTKSKKDVVCKKQLVEEMEGPVCKFAPPLNLCDCDFPVPPEAVPRCGPK